ncbi:hypothetical protein [Nonomuraea sp. NPDC001831]|uniref:hypothetical protein n=1 Tax=Nonomuraea sp. NPDC001831 TaxID=3364340 RepID=UPI0036932EB6
MQGVEASDSARQVNQVAVAHHRLGLKGEERVQVSGDDGPRLRGDRAVPSPAGRVSVERSEPGDGADTLLPGNERREDEPDQLGGCRADGEGRRLGDQYDRLAGHPEGLVEPLVDADEQQRRSLSAFDTAVRSASQNAR